MSSPLELNSSLKSEIETFLKDQKIRKERTEQYLSQIFSEKNLLEEELKSLKVEAINLQKELNILKQTSSKELIRQLK
jgi:hypothetical protein